MSELDDLKTQWAERDRRLDAHLKLNAQVLNAISMRRVAAAMRRLSWLLAVEAAFTLVVVVLLGDFLGDHFTNAAFALPAACLMVFAIACLGAIVRHAILARQVDPSEAITIAQKRIERLRMLRVRYTKWVFIFATLMWTCLLIVLPKALVGMDVYKAFGYRYVLANLIVSVAIIPLGIWACKALATRAVGSPALQRFIGDLAGTNLKHASEHLDAIARFELDTAAESVPGMK